MFIHHRRRLQQQGLVADTNARAVRQIIGIGEQRALPFGMFMENVDIGADQIFRVDRQEGGAGP